MMSVLLALTLATGPSVYEGPKFDPDHEGTRQCIAARESEGIRNIPSTNNYFGPYQMTDALVDGGVWMAMPELKRMFGKQRAVQLRDWLHRTPMNRWNDAWLQDLVFWTVYDHGAGAKHWRGGRWSCPTGMESWSR